MTIDNNNNNNKIVLLPIYIQKYIIKILCNHINKTSKIITIIDNNFNYFQNQLNNDILIISIALVNHDWFKTLSSNLNVAIDFNFREHGFNKWSIIKKENIKCLKIHFDQLNNTFFKKTIGSSYNYGIDQQNNNNNNNNNVIGIGEKKPINIGLKKLNEKLNNLSNINNNNNNEEKEDQDEEYNYYDNNNNNEVYSISNNNNNNNYSNLSNFKKLIFKTIDFSNLSRDSKIIKSLYQCKAIQNIHLYSLELNNSTTLESIIEQNKRIKKVFSIDILDCFNENIIFETFNNWSNSIKKLTIISENYIQYTYSLFEFLSGNINFDKIKSTTSNTNTISNLKNNKNNKNINKSSKSSKMSKISTIKEKNYLLNLESLKLSGIEIQLNEIINYIILPTCSKLKFLSIPICLDNLIYYLSNDDDRIKLSIERCACNSLINKQQFNDGDDKDDEIDLEFNKQWDNLLELLSSDNNINYSFFEINHQCLISKTRLKWNINKQLPISFIDKFVQLISSMKSLEKFSLSGIINITQIFNKLVNLNKNITSFNCSITNLSFDTKELIQELDTIVKQNNHIKEFTFINNSYNQLLDTFKTTILFNYKKNIKKQQLQLQSPIFKQTPLVVEQKQQKQQQQQKKNKFKNKK